MSQGECSGACQWQDCRLSTVWSDCGAGAIWLLHTAAKSMGGQGPVYQFASMSSVREVRTPSPHATVWLLSVLRALGRDIQDFQKSRLKKTKENQGLWEEGHWLWSKWKSSCMKLHRENDWATQCRHVGDVFQKRKDGKRKHLRFVDGALRYSWEIKQRRGERVQVGGGWGFCSLQMESTSNMEGGASVLNPRTTFYVGGAEPLEIHSL